jgi:ribosome-binding protein aMBF1 (putative translation factor)
MKSDCTRCGKNFKGLPFEATINGKTESFCNDCYVQVKKEYAQKAACDDCVFFDDGTCEYNGELTAVNLSGVDYFVQRETCTHFKDSSDQENAALKGTIKARNETDTLTNKLTQKGVVLTYYCCHCGKPLKIGAKHSILTTCPYCKNDLTAIDMAKLISQHL